MKDKTTDRVRHKRKTPEGKTVIDYEQITTTNFGGTYPETTADNITGKHLPCGHIINQAQNVLFGIYCTGKVGFLLRKKCNKACCNSCVYRCPKCANSISSACCTVYYNNEYICRTCRRRLRFINTFKAIFVNPFVGKDLDEEAKKELEMYRKIKEQQSRHHSDQE